MEKVLIKLNGTQNFLNGEINQIELTTEGTMEIKEEGYVVTYEESAMTGMEGTTTVMKILHTGVMELIRVGTTNSHLVFEEGVKKLSHYETIAGIFTLGVLANIVDIDVDNDGGIVRVEYIMDIDNQKTAENDIEIEITKV